MRVETAEGVGRGEVVARVRVVGMRVGRTVGSVKLDGEKVGRGERVETETGAEGDTVGRGVRVETGGAMVGRVPEGTGPRRDFSEEKYDMCGSATYLSLVAKPGRDLPRRR